MNFRQQYEICKLHKIAEAKQDWQERRYPEIDWDALDARLSRFQPVILRILDGEERSEFAEQLALMMNQEKMKTVMSRLNGADLEGMVPGYYGTKGGRMMYVYLALVGPSCPPYSCYEGFLPALY